jgi:hypothetical protein
MTNLYHDFVKPLYSPAYIAIPSVIRSRFRVSEVAKRTATLALLNDGDVDSTILMECELGCNMILVHSTVTKSSSILNTFIAAKRLTQGDVVAHYDPSVNSPSWLSSDPQEFSAVDNHANGCILGSCRRPISSNNILYTSCLGPYLHCGGTGVDTPNLILRFHPTIRWKLTDSSVKYFPLVEVVAMADISVGDKMVLSHMRLVKVANPKDRNSTKVIDYLIISSLS